MSTKITTGKVRFSYVNIFEPKATQGGQDKYSITLLIPKSDTFTLNLIKTAMQEAKEQYLAKNKGKQLPSNLKNTIHDGDGERPNGGEFGAECKGHYVMTVSSNTRPLIYDAEKKEIFDAKEVYSGCYGRAILNFYVYDTQGNKGISAGLLAVMKLHDGEALSGAVVTDEDWDNGWIDADANDFDDLLG